MKSIQIAVCLTILFCNLIVQSQPVDDFGKILLTDAIELTKGHKSDTRFSMKKLIEILLKWRFDPTKLGMDPYEHIKSFGYPSEQHIVTTEDGYILTVNRIPYGKSTLEKYNRPVVFLQPGMLCTPGCYIDVGPKKALAFLLADLGFDVWLGTVRGTTFSRNHTTLDPVKDKKKYWNYSWHEVGTIDIPTVIDYILNVTGHRSISYIGHSQGTTAYFVMGAEKPEYNDKINVMIALAPVAFMGNMNKNSSLYSLAQRKQEIFPLLRLVGIYDVFPHFDPITKYIQSVCNDNLTDLNECAAVWDQVQGYNPEMFDLQNLYVISEHLPGGASIKQLEHYAQCIVDGEFRHFDYGKRKNIKKYGQSVPPAYNLSNIKTPVYLMYGDNDVFTALKDLQTLHAALPNSTMFRVNYDLFGHGDFLYAKEVIQLLYNYVFEVLLKHSFGN